MSAKILIVEDQFIEANDLRIILKRAGHTVSGIAKSVDQALLLIKKETPEIVLLDIFLKGDLTGIDLAKVLSRENIPFIYLSANSEQATFEAAKATQPYGFLVKPFREKDILVALEIASYRHQHLTGLLGSPDREKPSASVPRSRIKGIVGNSPGLLQVLDQVNQVAPFDTTVLIMGETGVGKEGVAQAIHDLSTRKDKPFIKINCAAIPSNLIESELFGHERGAFTNALEKRIGKFEQAQGGTIFLDEIGEIPMEVQSKLLRVLQEKEIERIGGRGVIRINTRIIAATNRNLYQEVAAGKFRIDLYYRINVFPLILPPLRDRREDIPQLVDHFLLQNAGLSGNVPKKIAPDALRLLVNYSWPGNIRELQHLVERHILITESSTISRVELPDEGIFETKTPVDEQQFQSIADIEKAHIVAVLKKCNGKVSGKGGAAEVLKIPATTLTSKMKKLGIVWQFLFE